jgi:hypothetical protein
MNNEDFNVLVLWIHMTANYIMRIDNNFQTNIIKWCTILIALNYWWEHIEIRFS